MFEDYMSNFLSNKKYSASFPFSNLQDGINTTKIIKAMESSNKFGQIIKIWVKLLYILEQEKILKA